MSYFLYISYVFVFNKRIKVICARRLMGGPIREVRGGQTPGSTSMPEKEPLTKAGRAHRDLRGGAIFKE